MTGVGPGSCCAAGGDPAQQVTRKVCASASSTHQHATLVLIALTVSIISMSVRFTRQVSSLRRVTIPKKLAVAADIPDKGYVVVTKPRRSPPVLLLTPVPEPEDKKEKDTRDPARPRRLNPVGQVTLPAPLMNLVRLEPLQWVYVSKSNSGTGVLIEPAGDL